ncbi:MAG: T9SS type B sorting domain-containing protein [Salibacteraceae bacterium]
MIKSSVYSVAKNLRFLVFFMFALLLGNEVIAQDCTDLYGATGEPSSGLQFNICVQDPGFVILNATATGTTPATAYTWAAGGTNPVKPVVSAGTYVVTVSTSTNISACILSYTVTSSDNPIPDLSTSDSIFCSGSQGVLRAPDYYTSYSWSSGTSTDDSLVVTTAGQYHLTVTDTNSCVGSDSIVVVLDTLPVINLGTGSSLCVGDSTTIDAGLGYVSYLWNTGDTTSDLTIINSGTYSVTVVDSNSCSGDDSYVLSNYIMPNVDLGLDDTICDGANVILDAGAGYVTYNWSNGSTTQTSMYDSTGNHWVEVTDGNGCTGSDSMNLLVNPKPILDLGPNDTICASDGYNLNAGNPGGAIVSYLWSTGSTNQSISIVADPSLSADKVEDYSVTITDINGCENEDTLTLTTFVLPSPDLGNDTSFCTGDPFSMALSPGIFSSYIWSNGALSPVITIGANPNTYSITVTDARGCQNEDAMTVTSNPKPTPNIGPDEDYCEGSNFTRILNAGFYESYLWNDGSTGQILGVSFAGTYSVTVTDTNNCSNFDEVVITENPVPVVDLGADVTFCEDEIVNHLLDASAMLPSNNFNFLWNTGETSGTIIATNFGIHSVVVTDQTTNCFAASSMEIIAMEKAVPDLGDDGVVCQGQLVILDPQVSIPGYNYTWSNGATTSTTNIFETGFYWVQLDAANGTCMGIRDSVYYSHGVLPVVDLGSDQYVCDGQIVTLLNGATSFPQAIYKWQDGSTSKSYVVTETGTYDVEVTNNCGTVVDQVYIEFQDCSNVYVPNSFTPNGDGRNETFYPSTDQEFSEYGFWVYDRWGSLLFKTNEPNHGWDGTVNGELMKPGIYVWRISYVSSYQEFGLRVEKTGQFNLLR